MLLVIGLVAGAAQAEMLANPGFEEGTFTGGPGDYPPGWSFYYSGTSSAYSWLSGEGAHSGTKYMRLNPWYPSPSYDAYVYQTVPDVIAGQDYAFSAWTKNEVPSDTNPGWFYLEWRDTGNAVVSTIEVDIAGTHSEWTQLDFGVHTAPAGAVAAQFRLVIYGYDPSGWFIDDLSMRPGMWTNPVDGQRVPVTFNLLQWELPAPADPETGTVTCDVWFTDNFPEYNGTSDPNFTNYATKIVNNQAVESKSVTLAADNTYYWRIDTYDSSSANPQPVIGKVLIFDTFNMAPVVDAGEADPAWLTDGTVDFDLLGELVADDGRPKAATLLWTVTDEPSPGAATIITDPTKPGITVTATQTGMYELTLTADDTDLTDSDTVSIRVYADWCEAAKAQGLTPHATDLNGDCITDMRDFAILAGEFLLEITDVVPVVGLVPNGDFETIYKPGSTTITGVLSEAAWTQGVGINCPIDSGSGTYNFSDTTSGTVADIPGWVGYDKDGWLAFGGTYGRDPNFPDRQGSTSNQANHTDGEEAANCYLTNGGGWGNPAGGLIISKNSVATVAADTAYVISMFAKGVEGNEAPLVLDLLANGVKITPDHSGNPVLLTDLWREYTRTYNADTMSAHAGKSLKIVVGLGRPLPDGSVGAQLQLDDVAIVGYSN